MSLLQLLITWRFWLSITYYRLLLWKSVYYLLLFYYLLLITPCLSAYSNWSLATYPLLYSWSKIRCLYLQALHFSPTLYDYVTRELQKSIILVLNKIDLAPPALVVAWKHYFHSKFPQVHIVCFTSFPKDSGEKQLMNEDPGKSEWDFFSRYFGHIFETRVFFLKNI